MEVNIHETTKINHYHRHFPIFFLAGCTSNDGDTVQLEIISLNENDWVGGQIEISIKSEMTFSEEIEVWINGNPFSDEELGIRKYFNIDISEFSDEKAALDLHIQLIHQNITTEVNVTALFPQQMTFGPQKIFNQS